MCGRAYSTYTEEEIYWRYISKRKVKFELEKPLKPNYNMSPTQLQSIVFRDEAKDPEIALARWGLIPSWAKDIKIGYKMINARAETVAEKPSFRSAYKRRRCIVPLSGFFEWKRDGEVKRPFAIHLKDDPIMSVAGLWESWQSPEGKEEIRSFTILTTEANSFMEKIHDRMPVILPKVAEEQWLDPQMEAEGLGKLLKPCPSSWLKAHEVSILVNNPRNNRAELLEAVGQEK